MKTGTGLMVTVVLVIAQVCAHAQQSAVAPGNTVNDTRIIASTSMRPGHKSASPLDQARDDVLSILSQNNSCSHFFGDPKAAEEALRRLVSQFEIRLLRDSRTGIEMSGAFTYFAQSERSAGYRLFTRATINLQGPFLKAKVFRADPFVPRVGSFPPNTREVRVLMLLHELAHLIRGKDGHWLIPDDAHAQAVSVRNTALLESQCQRQILSLAKLPA